MRWLVASTRARWPSWSSPVDSASPRPSSTSGRHWTRRPSDHQSGRQSERLPALDVGQPAPTEQVVHRRGADAHLRRGQGGQRRVDQGAVDDVVEADEADIVRYPYSGLTDLLEKS